MFRVTLIVLIASGLCGLLAFLFHFIEGSIFGIIEAAKLVSVFKDVALLLIVLAAFCFLVAMIIKLLLRK